MIKLLQLVTSEKRAIKAKIALGRYSQVEKTMKTRQSDQIQKILELEYQSQVKKISTQDFKERYIF